MIPPRHHFHYGNFLCEKHFTLFRVKPFNFYHESSEDREKIIYGGESIDVLIIISMQKF